MAWATSDRAARLPADWPRIRRRILRRDGHQCRIRIEGRCIGTATEVDHVQAGDDHGDHNLQAACSPCHAHKSALEGATASAQARATRPRRRPVEPHPGLL